MKKIVFGGIAIVVIAVVAALSVNLKSNEYGLSEVGLSNAEALADKQQVQCFVRPDYECCCNIYDRTSGCYCGM